MQSDQEIESRFGTLLLHQMTKHGRGVRNVRSLALPLLCSPLVVLFILFLGGSLASLSIGDFVLPPLVLRRLHSSEVGYWGKSA